MKNLFKYLSAFAIAGVIGLSNVDAVECANGQKTHTDYYMFLNVDSANYFKNKLTSASSLMHWTGGNKVNLIGDNGGKFSGNKVAVTRGNETTVPSGTKESWTVGEYWKNLYVAKSAFDSEDLTYTEGDKTYLFHSGWQSYEENWNNGTPHAPAVNAEETRSALLEYIGEHLNDIETSELATKGTSLPESNVVEPTNLGKTDDSPLEWRISRKFTAKDALEGATISGTKVIYSPAVYSVQYCVGEPTEETEKFVRYDANVEKADTVTGMPADQKFTDKTNISSKVPKREGYEFLGWSKDPKATEADPAFAAEKEYSGDSITLYAVWKKKAESNPDGSYTVTYDANGGKGAPKAQTGAKDACIKITDVKPTLTGNNFLGWSTDPKAKEADANYAAGKEYCGKNGNITLYAVWQTQTGVSAHLVAFGTVALASVGALIVAKKKNLFRQI